MTFDWKTKNINILGTTYTVELSSDEVKYPMLKKANGYIDSTIKQIVVRDKFDQDDDDAMKELDVVIKKNLRHEVIHGFLYESGLDWDSNKATTWAVNEEMVDYFALQFPKMIEVLNGLGAL